jgi:hypothetical protein
LLRGGVDPIGDLVQGFVEVPNGESFLEPSASIYSLSVVVASGVLGFGSLLYGCVG